MLKVLATYLSDKEESLVRTVTMKSYSDLMLSSMVPAARAEWRVVCVGAFDHKVRA